MGVVCEWCLEYEVCVVCVCVCTCVCVYVFVCMCVCMCGLQQNMIKRYFLKMSRKGDYWHEM